MCVLDQFVFVFVLCIPMWVSHISINQSIKGVKNILTTIYHSKLATGFLLSASWIYGSMRMHLLYLV